MHKSATILALAAGAALAATSAFAETREFSDLALFEAINASAGVSVEVTPADTQQVTAEADKADAFDHLRVEVENGTLVITREGNLLDFIFDGGLVGAIFGSDDNLTVRVTTPTLTGADASSGADMTVTGFTLENLTANSSSGADLDLVDLTAGTLQLSSSSGADLNATGSCTTLDADTSSGADLDAAGLECEAGNLNASSGASLSARITGGVSVDVSSGADVTIYGDPQSTDLSQSSGGSISLRD